MDRFVPKADTGKRERSAQIIAGIAELRSRLRKLKYTKVGIASAKRGTPGAQSSDFHFTAEHVD